MTREGFLPEVQIKGDYFKHNLQLLAEKYGLDGQVRGLGLMLGLEVGVRGPEIVNTCCQKGLLINCIGGTILRFLPPLTVTKEEIDEALAILKEAFALVFS